MCRDMNLPFAKFEEDITDEQIYDMLLEGHIKCLCCSCKQKMKVLSELECIRCPNCLQIQLLPTDDPKNYTNAEDDETGIPI